MPICGEFSWNPQKSKGGAIFSESGTTSRLLDELPIDRQEFPLVARDEIPKVTQEGQQLVQSLGWSIPYAGNRFSELLLSAVDLLRTIDREAFFA
jgi:hypothetical protein